MCQPTVHHCLPHSWLKTILCSNHYSSLFSKNHYSTDQNDHCDHGFYWTRQSFFVFHLWKSLYRFVTFVMCPWHKNKSHLTKHFMTWPDTKITWNSIQFFFILDVQFVFTGTQYKYISFHVHKSCIYFIFDQIIKYFQNTNEWIPE